MATWAGWQQQLLKAAGFSTSASNVRFLTEWHQHATTDCTNNPIDLSIRSPGAGDCANLPGIFPKAQHYDTHGHAAHAFDTEVHMKFANAIENALVSGNPYTFGGANDVASALVSWGSDAFAKFYSGETRSTSGGGGSGGGGIAPRTHRAWIDLQRSVNKRLPAALRKTDTANRATLRTLGRTRKVGR